MEDIKDAYPHVYNKKVKKSGNDFITEVDKMSNFLNKRIHNESDEDLMEFYTQIVSMGTVFRDWVSSL